MAPTLDGKRVRLRPLRETDEDALFGLFSDPEAMRYWSCPPFTERAQARKKLDEARSCGLTDGYLSWGIAETPGDALLGTFALHKLDLPSGRAEIGYMLARTHWGQGLAREAVALAIDHAFGPLGLRRLEADIDPRNAASQKLLERLGFAREGLLRERWKVGDEISDTAFYGLLKRDWETDR